MVENLFSVDNQSIYYKLRAMTALKLNINDSAEILKIIYLISYVSASISIPQIQVYRKKQEFLT